MLPLRGGRMLISRGLPDAPSPDGARLRCAAGRSRDLAWRQAAPDARMIANRDRSNNDSHNRRRSADAYEKVLHDRWSGGGRSRPGSLQGNGNFAVGNASAAPDRYGPASRAAG